MGGTPAGTEECKVCDGTGEYTNTAGETTYCSGCGGTGIVAKK